MSRDLRFAIRMLLKQPAFDLIAVLTLGLGIGATSAVFSLIQGVLLTPPPYQKPEQLVPIPTVISTICSEVRAASHVAIPRERLRHYLPTRAAFHGDRDNAVGSIRHRRPRNLREVGDSSTLSNESVAITDESGTSEGGRTNEDER
jgi:hypothetical protein